MKQDWVLRALPAVLGVALLMSASPALADDTGTIHLMCQPSGPNAAVMIQDDPTVIDLNEAQATATVHFAAFSLKGQLNGSNPARTVGPMHATFSDEAVTFENPNPNSAPNGGPDEYVLNRLTGDFRGKWGEEQLSCHVATKQF